MRKLVLLIIACILVGYVVLNVHFGRPSLLGHHPEEEPRVRVPSLIPLHERLEARDYADEIPKPGEVTTPQSIETPAPTVPFDARRLTGIVSDADHNTSVGMWAIITFEGDRWASPRQHLYVYTEATNDLREISELEGDHSIGEAAILSPADHGSALIAASLDDYAREIWAFDLPDGPARFVASGRWLIPSPDHHSASLQLSRIMEGFHVLKLWDLSADSIRPVMSIWDLNPSDVQQTWFSHWSKDSKALIIRGSSSGFEAEPGDEMELDLVYLVADDAMVNLR